MEFFLHIVIIYLSRSCIMIREFLLSLSLRSFESTHTLVLLFAFRFSLLRLLPCSLARCFVVDEYFFFFFSLFAFLFA